MVEVSELIHRLDQETTHWTGRTVEGLFEMPLSATALLSPRSAWYFDD